MPDIARLCSPGKRDGLIDMRERELAMFGEYVPRIGQFDTPRRAREQRRAYRSPPAP